MFTLGIETSCDETSVAVLKGSRTVLSNVISSSLLLHKPFGGVVPEIASRAQSEALLPSLDEALRKAKISLKKIDLVAVTQGPGLMGSLLVGLSAAKALAMALEKPLIGVDHVIAHLYSGFLADKALRFPLLGLAVSGGHTALIRMDSPSRWRVLGATHDDAAGEAFDKVAKIMGLGYPGGPEIDRLAKGVDPNQVFFTRPFLSQDSLDFSFSGIKTALFYKVKEIQQTKRLTSGLIKALAAGFQEAVCEVLVEKTLRAAKKQKLSRVVVGGGVSANSRLRRLFSQRAASQGLKVVFPALNLCQDNAAMIAGLGRALYNIGRRDSLGLCAYARFGQKKEVQYAGTKK